VEHLPLHCSYSHLFTFFDWYYRYCSVVIDCIVPFVTGTVVLGVVVDDDCVFTDSDLVVMVVLFTT